MKEGKLQYTESDDWNYRPIWMKCWEKLKNIWMENENEKSWNCIWEEFREFSRFFRHSAEVMRGSWRECWAVGEWKRSSTFFRFSFSHEMCECDENWKPPTLHVRKIVQCVWYFVVDENTLEILENMTCYIYAKIILFVLNFCLL